MIDSRKILQTGKPVRQGEVLIYRHDKAPKGVFEMMQKGFAKHLELENGKLILGHSETGHHHILEPIEDRKNAEVVIRHAEGLIAEMEVEYESELKHMREHDTHKSILIPPGKYIVVKRQEQSQIEGWIKSLD